MKLKQITWKHQVHNCNLCSTYQYQNM